MECLLIDATADSCFGLHVHVHVFGPCHCGGVAHGCTCTYKCSHMLYYSRASSPLPPPSLLPPSRPARCLEGFFSDSLGSVECAECPAGSECPRTDDSPAPCETGSYALSGQSRCTPCPVGFRSATPNLVLHTLGSYRLYSSLVSNLVISV